MTVPIQHIPLRTIAGGACSLADYAGKVLLLVNVASKCGLTTQYEALEKLYQDRKDRGLVVLGFPANDFLAQEPGVEAEIAEFCRTNYSITFPMFSKIAVTGEAQHPLYRELVAARPEAEGDPEAFRKRLIGHGIQTNPAPGVLWNFEKFLVARDGTIVARFAPQVTPDDRLLVAAIDGELTKQ